MTACPTPDELRRLVADTTSGADAAAFAAHLETCSDCQRALDQLTLSGPVPHPTADGAGQATDTFPAREVAPAGIPELPGYAVLEVLGRGGMGVVYKARQAGLNRVVALKMVLGDGGVDPGALARFLAEAEAMAAVRHPHVATVYDFGASHGRPYLALEYLSGGTLAARLKNAALTPIEAAGLVGKLARAVGAAHALGIVHRDLKPGNVLFDADGEPKVTDFGLAKRGGGSDLTRTQAVMGTPAYMAPEQARGDAKFVTPAADVYALGVILYECLAGRRPFDHPDPLALMRLVADGELTPPRARNPAVPRDLDLICRKCLEKDPADRYPTGTDLTDDLGRFLNGESVSARTPGAIERVAKWARRKPTAAAAWALGVAVAVVAGVAVALAVAFAAADRERHTAEAERGNAEGARAEAERQRDRADTERRGAVTARTEAETQRDRAAESKKQAEAQRDLAAGLKKDAEAARDQETAAKKRAEDAERRLAVSDYGRTLQVAHQEWRDNHFGPALALLDRTKPELRDWEWRYLHRLCHADELTLGKPGIMPVRASFRANGSQVLTDCGDGSVRLWDAGTGKELRRFVTGKGGGQNGLAAAAISPDGSRVVGVGNDGMLHVWDFRTSELIHSFPIGPDPDRLFAAGFHPDGKSLVTGSRGKAVVWDTRTWEKRRVILVPGSPPVRVATFTPDGSQILTNGELGKLHFWDTETGEGKLSFTASPFEGDLWTAALNPDGSRVLTEARSPDGARITDTRNGKLLLTLPVPPGGVLSAAFSRNGTRIATGGRDGTIRIWDAVTGKELQVLRGHGGRPINTIAFSPDGTRLVTGGDDWTARVWNLRVNPEYLVSFPVRYPKSAVWSPDGKQVVIACKTPTATEDLASVRDAATGKLLFELQARHNEILVVAWSPDGQWLATGGDDKTARIWDARTGKPHRTLPHGEWVAAVAFGPDGSLATAAHDQKVRVWDPVSGELRREFGSPISGQGRLGLAWSPDGTKLVAGTDNLNPGIWEFRTGRRLFNMVHPSEVLAVAFSPDGSKIATGDHDGIVRLWDATTGKLLLTMEGHFGIVAGISWRPPGSGPPRLLTAGYDGTARIWDPTTGAELLTLQLSQAYVQGAVWSPDGERILAVAGWESARIFGTTPINRAFTPREPAPPPRPVK